MTNADDWKADAQSEQQRESRVSTTQGDPTERRRVDKRAAREMTERRSGDPYIYDKEWEYDESMRLWDPVTNRNSAELQERMKLAGFDDPLMLEYADELRRDALGLSGISEWETEVRKQMSENVKRLYQSTQTSGGNRMATRTRMEKGLSASRVKFDEYINKGREREQEMYLEKFQQLRRAGSREGRAAVQASTLLEQSLEREREKDKSAMWMSILAAIGTIGGAAIMAPFTLGMSAVAATAAIGTAATLGGSIGKATGAVVS